MTATKTKELALSRDQLGWLRDFLGEVQDSVVNIETATINIDPHTQSFKMAFRTDDDGDVVPHILIRVPA